MQEITVLKCDAGWPLHTQHSMHTGRPSSRIPASLWTRGCNYLALSFSASLSMEANPGWVLKDSDPKHFSMPLSCGYMEECWVEDTVFMALMSMSWRDWDCPHQQNYFDYFDRQDCGTSLPEVVTWDLLNRDLDWCALVRDDLFWLWKQLANSSSLQSPDAHFASWRYLWVYHRAYWKGLIKRAMQHAIMQRHNEYVVKHGHQQILEVPQKGGHVHLPRQEEARPPTEQGAFNELFGCLHCNLTFETKGGGRSPYVQATWQCCFTSSTFRSHHMWNLHAWIFHI